MTQFDVTISKTTEQRYRVKAETQLEAELKALEWSEKGTIATDTVVKTVITTTKSDK